MYRKRTGVVVKTGLRQWWAHLKQAFRDPGCRGCHQDVEDSGHFCVKCLRNLGFRPAEDLWTAEALPLVENWAPEAQADILQAGVSEVSIDAVTEWMPWTRALIYGYKFEGRTQHQTLLVDMLYERLMERLPQLVQAPDGLGPVWIVPVPAHTPERNHMKRLAEALSLRFPLAQYQPVLRWRRRTRPQHQLESGKIRRANVSKAFQLATFTTFKKAQPPGLVIVLDDLTTTQATLKEAVQAVQSQWPMDVSEVPSVLGLALMSVPLGGRRQAPQPYNHLPDVSDWENPAPEWTLNTL